MQGYRTGGGKGVVCSDLGGTGVLRGAYHFLKQFFGGLHWVLGIISVLGDELMRKVIIFVAAIGMMIFAAYSVEGKPDGSLGKDCKKCHKDGPPKGSVYESNVVDFRGVSD